jgi:hypothetical protein
MEILEIWEIIVGMNGDSGHPLKCMETIIGMNGDSSISS